LALSYIDANSFVVSRREESIVGAPRAIFIFGSSRGMHHDFEKFGIRIGRMNNLGRKALELLPTAALFLLSFVQSKGGTNGVTSQAAAIAVDPAKPMDVYAVAMRCHGGSVPSEKEGFDKSLTTVTGFLNLVVGQTRTQIHEWLPVLFPTMMWLRTCLPTW
jgi:hypothetical protein